jgi:hypothetical protein
MATHRETGTFEGQPEQTSSLDKLVDFYLANGYLQVDLTEPDGETAPAAVRLERGKSGAGWWTSDMTKLYTQLDLEWTGEHVAFTYEVDTSGQILKDVEKAFWRREVQWARRYLAGDVDTPRDLREEEAQRADQQENSLMSIGVTGAVVVFLAIITLALLGVI